MRARARAGKQKQKNSRALSLSSTHCSSPPPRKQLLPARSLAGLPLPHAMHTSLRLSSQGLAQVRTGRLDPSAGEEQVCRSVGKREEEAEISRLAPFLSLKIFVLLSRKKSTLQQRASPRSTRGSSTRAQAVSAPTSAPASSTQVRVFFVFIEASIPSHIREARESSSRALSPRAVSSTGMQMGTAESCATSVVVGMRSQGLSTRSGGSSTDLDAKKSGDAPPLFFADADGCALSLSPPYLSLSSTSLPRKQNMAPPPTR